MLELLFALPLVTLLLVVALDYASVLMTREGLTHAVTVGAREAAKGGRIGDVVEAVNGVLAAHQITITDQRGSGTKLVVQDGCGPIAEYGDPNLSCQPSPCVRPNEVCVTVRIDSCAKKTDGLKPALASFDLLGLRKQGFFVRSSVKKERVRAKRWGNGSTIAVACRN